MLHFAAASLFCAFIDLKLILLDGCARCSFRNPMFATLTQVNKTRFGLQNFVISPWSHFGCSWIIEVLTSKVSEFAHLNVIASLQLFLKVNFQSENLPNQHYKYIYIYKYILFFWGGGGGIHACYDELTWLMISLPPLSLIHNTEAGAICVSCVRMCRKKD